MLTLYLNTIDYTDDKEKFEKLYIKYRSKMYYVAMSVLHDRYDAEDALHNAFIAVAKNINKIADINSDETTAYLFRTAKNTALNVYSKKKRQAEREILVDNYCDIDNISDGELIGEAEKTQFEEVVSCIESLPEHYRTVLGLHFRQEYTAPQIAKTLGINQATACAGKENASYQASGGAKMKSNDNRLARAFEEAEKREIAQLPEDKNILWTPSADFEDKMAKLICGNKKQYRGLAGFSARRIACIALVVLTMFGTAMSVKAIRKPIVRFLVETNEKFAMMISSGQKETTMPETIEKAYTLSDCLRSKGYEMTLESTETLVHYEVYEDASGNKIVFNQSVLASTYITIDAGNLLIEDISVNNNSGKYHQNKATVNLVWTDSGYVFEITAPSSVGREDLINIAKGLKVK